MHLNTLLWTARITAASKLIKSQLTVRDLAYEIVNELGPPALPDVPKASLVDLCMEVDYAGDEHITYKLASLNNLQT